MARTAKKTKRPKTARKFVRRRVTTDDLAQGFQVVEKRSDLGFADNPFHTNDEPKAKK